jgi:hypothetical protein
VPEAVPAPLLSPALIPRLLFPAARACYGAALVCVPGLALGLATGQPPGARDRMVARILGVRHQAVLTAYRPRPRVFLAGAGVDACHAASMLALAAADPRLRRAGLADAFAATAFTATGALTATRTGAAGVIASAAVASARPPG